MYDYEFVACFFINGLNNKKEPLIELKDSFYMIFLPFKWNYLISMFPSTQFKALLKSSFLNPLNSPGTT